MTVTGVFAFVALAVGSAGSSFDHGHRVLIQREDDIARVLRLGGMSGRFDIEAVEVEGSSDSRNGTTSSDVILHLDLMRPALTSRTECEFTSGQPPGDTIGSFSVLSSGGDHGDFTLVSFNQASGELRGLQRSFHGDTKKITLGKSTSRSSRNDKFLQVQAAAPPKGAFECAVNHGDDHHHGHVSPRQLNLFLEGEDPEGEVPEVGDNEHSYHHDHSHREDDVHLFDIQDLGAGLRNIGTIEGADVEAVVGFRINIGIVVDAKFIKTQGGVPEAVEYINLLISAANVVFNDVDVHLNIVKVQEIDIFDSVSTLRDGLRTMREHFVGVVGSEIHVMHALLGKGLGGGIAFIDSITDARWGFGISSGLEGKIRSLDGQAIDDIFMVVHELGHSLGSGHTFDSFDPPVDTCGVSCPEELPKENSASVMSYCNFCEGGVSNIALTLGGEHIGAGAKTNLTTWQPHPNLALSNVTDKPERVSHHVYSTLLAKGGSIRRDASDVDSILCAFDSECKDGDQCTVNSCIDSVCQVEEILDVCLGNGICQEGELYTDDCGPYTIGSIQVCIACSSLAGFMFDVSAASGAVFVTQIDFNINFISSNYSTVKLYATKGSHVGKETDPSKWEQVGSASVPSSNTTGQVVVDPPLYIGGLRGLYLLTDDGFISFSPQNNDSYLPDENGVSILDGTATAWQWQAEIPGPFMLNGEVEYRLEEQVPSRAPSTMPSSRPSLAPSLPSVPDSQYFIQMNKTCEPSCFNADGVMFNVGVGAGRETMDIAITSLQFEHISTNATVEVYVTEMDDKVIAARSSKSLWTMAGSINITQGISSVVYFSDDAILISPGSRRGFYLASSDSSNIFVLGIGSFERSDRNGLMLSGGLVVFDKFGLSIPGYQFSITVGYSNSSLLLGDDAVHQNSPSTEPSTHFPSEAPSPLLDEIFQLEAGEYCEHNCTRAQGYMFSVRNGRKAKTPINVTSIHFEHSSPQEGSDVKVYTTVDGSHVGTESLNDWVTIASVVIPRNDTGESTSIVFDYPVQVPIDDRVGFYIKATDNIILLGLQNDVKSSPDMNKVKLKKGTAVFDNSTSSEEYSWNGGITYYKDMGGRENLTELNSRNETIN